MGHELRAAFDEADADDDVRAIIVTGAGRGFCAGADLAGGGDTFDYRKRDVAGAAGRDNGGEFSLRIFDSKKPVIGAINGPAVGVGATMTLPMDIRLAADDAKMGFVFSRRGIIPEACSSWFLPRVVGISQAMEWVSTGRVFSAQEASRGRARSGAFTPRTSCWRAARELAQRDRPEHRSRLRRPGPSADVADARRRAPDDGSPGRLTRAWSPAASRPMWSRA